MMRRIILWVLLFLPLAALSACFLWLLTSLPQTQGRLRLPDLTAEARITRDANGIPTIVASNDHDAAFALGFAHAQDRLFQMDLTRRLVAGRLAEWFGDRALNSDRFMRVLGLHGLAERQYALLSPELRAALDGYTAGINAFLKQRRGALPPEYYLLNATPAAWHNADSLAWGKLMSLMLAGNFRSELFHARLRNRLKPEELAVLFPPYPKDAPTAYRDSTAGLDDGALRRLAAALPSWVGPRTASNNWVVSGQHTLSGKPLLANDPHLGFSAPSIWYLARIETPEGTRVGATAPSAPFVIIGHNARIAWGFTNTGSDVEDLFLEKIDPADPTRYLTPDGSQPFETRRETIFVRGGEPISFTVRATRHGPVLSDLGEPYPAAAGTVLALQATWLAEDDRSPEALWGMTRAANWSEFRQALANFAAPQQNVVYADIDGNIGFIAPARVPVRAKGDGWTPSPGWTGEYDWTGFIPFDALPAAYNPPDGRIVTANNKVVPENYPYFLTREWEIPNRAERITDLLRDQAKQSPDTFAMIQADTLSFAATQLMPILLRTQATSARAKEALALLREWSGRMNRDEAAPLIFTAWLREINRSLFAEKLGDLFEPYWQLHPDVVHSILTAHHDWCDESATPPSCSAQLSTSLERALEQLVTTYGADPRKWRWGVAHEAQFTNQFWSNVPFLGRHLAVQIPADGGFDTINRGATPIRSVTNPYADVHGSTLRMIVDLADIDATRFMISPGQSGSPLSLHYDDLMQRWRDVTYVSLRPHPTGETLALAPP